MAPAIKTEESSAPGARDAVGAQPAKSANAGDRSPPRDQLTGAELLAAYLSREPDLAPLMRTLFDMTDAQRRLGLVMLQCIAMGGTAAR